jgi:hypothetical protein
VLRQRCDARGFTPPPIEILARRKVAPAFEPQKLLSVDGPPRLHRNPHDEGLAKIRQIRGRETGPPSRACNLLFGNLVDLTFQSALDCFLANAQDEAGHAAIRTVKRWVVLPIADLAWRLHLVVWRNLLAHSRRRGSRGAVGWNWSENVGSV